MFPQIPFGFQTNVRLYRANSTIGISNISVVSFVGEVRYALSSMGLRDINSYTDLQLVRYADSLVGLNGIATQTYLNSVKQAQSIIEINPVIIRTLLSRLSQATSIVDLTNVSTTATGSLIPSGQLYWRGITQDQWRGITQDQWRSIEQSEPLSLWTPANITTQLWLDASDSATITLDSGAVSQWDDKSGNARNAIAAQSTNRPSIASLALNGKNVIRFSGVPQRLIIPTFSSSQPFNVFVVAKVGNTAGFEVILDSYNDVRFPIAKNPTAGNLLYVGSNSGADIFDTITRTNYFIINVSANGASSALRVNAGTAISGNLATNSYSGLSIGERRGNPTPVGNDNLIGDVAEIIFISGAITTDIRERTEGYLAHKWGLTANLPSDHPYKNSPPIV